MKVFGLFGEKLSHSLSPIIHNMLYTALNIQASYSLYEIRPELLYDATKGLKALNISGVNVTIPYKLKVMEYLDKISDEALRIGAVNTIHNNNSQLVGYNTDYLGFGRMLKKNSIDVRQKSAVILGSGGAAKSVVTYLEDNDISKIYIISRNPESILTIDRSKYEILDYRDLENIESSNLLINCTPCGMYPNIDCSPIDETFISRYEAIIDLIYNPNETLLLKHAKKHDKSAINGLYMLVAQAAAAVEIWTEQTIDDAIIENVYCKLNQNLNI